jgi:Flp pilus assembly pilin Flp
MQLFMRLVRDETRVHPSEYGLIAANVAATILFLALEVPNGL